MKSDTRPVRVATERTQLELFHALPGDVAARDAQDLMAYPFFALGKNRRTIPIHSTLHDERSHRFAALRL